MTYPGPDWCVCPHHPRLSWEVAMTKAECEKLVPYYTPSYAVENVLAQVRKDHNQVIQVVPVDMREFA